MKKLAIITTHPIQYNAPLFKLLTGRNNIQVRVFYTWGESVLQDKFDPGFGQSIEWDIPLLEGYDFCFVENIAKNPGSHHYWGIDNPGLASELLEWKPDALLIYGWSFKSHFMLMRQFHKRIPIYFRGDSTLLNEQKGFSFRKLRRKYFLKWMYRHVDRAFYVGSANKSYYQKMGLAEDQLVFAAHAVDNERFAAPVAQDWRKRLGIQESETVFLYAGKFEPVKNLSLLLDAFLAFHQPLTHLVLVGNGPLEAVLKNTAANHPNVHFVDFQNQSSMPGLYQMSDVFVMASKSETWGLAINEAMAAGNAILASNKCGAAADLIRENINGFIFESDNKEDLLQKMQLISRLPIAEMGQASKQIIADWNYETAAIQIEQTLLKEMQT